MVVVTPWWWLSFVATNIPYHVMVDGGWPLSRPYGWLHPPPGLELQSPGDGVQSTCLWVSWCKLHRALNAHAFRIWMIDFDGFWAVMNREFDLFRWFWNDLDGLSNAFWTFSWIWNININSGASESDSVIPLLLQYRRSWAADIKASCVFLFFWRA